VRVLGRASDPREFDDAAARQAAGDGAALDRARRHRGDGLSVDEQEVVLLGEGAPVRAQRMPPGFVQRVDIGARDLADGDRRGGWRVRAWGNGRARGRPEGAGEPSLAAVGERNPNLARRRVDRGQRRDGGAGGLPVRRRLIAGSRCERLHWGLLEARVE
jgi:hypothetical protein